MPSPYQVRTEVEAARACTARRRASGALAFLFGVTAVLAAEPSALGQGTVPRNPATQAPGAQPKPAGPSAPANNPPGQAAANSADDMAGPTEAELAAARDPGPTPAPSMTFEEVIRKSLEQNPTVEVAIEEIKRSQALVEQSRSAWLPSLTGNATYTRLDDDRRLADRVLANKNQLNANITLTVPLLNARGWAATARAKDNVEFSRLSTVDAKRQIALQAGRAYLTVIAQHRVLESSINARNQARAHEEYAKSRFNGGIGNRLDAVRASQERAASENRVQTQTLALTRAQEALGVLLGDSGPVDASDVTLPEPPPLAAALSEAETKRADVLAQRSRTELTRKAVRDNYTDYLPLLSANAQPFYTNPATPTLPETGWQAQLILSIPFYDGGNRYGLAHEREALYEQSKTRLEAVLRQARSDVRTTFEAVRRADAALIQAREAAKLATEALDLAQVAYRAGATTNIEVIDAERRALDANTDSAVAEDNARQARLDLLSASGRFPERDQQQPK